MINVERDCELLLAGTEKVVPQNGLAEKLRIAKVEGRALVIKLGFDPTAPDLHLGHAVVLRKLRQFQDLGHKIVVIIGSFTAEIGDPTGKNKMRPPLSQEQVAKNAETYIAQLAKVLDLNTIEIRPNGEWFNQMTPRDIVRLLAQHTLARIMEREDFSNRFKDGTPIALHELLYPLLQGYDSREIKADVEIGGSDQLFNCLVGRHMQEAQGEAAQVVVCMPLLVGTDGVVKMSKSKGNYIGLTEGPNDIFGKIMSIPDSLIANYIQLATDFSLEDQQALLARLSSGENPMNIKKELAHNVVTQYHSAEAATAAGEFFRRQVQDRSLESKEFTEISLDTLGVASQSLIDICLAILASRSSEAAPSKSEIRQLIQAGAVTINGTKINTITHEVVIPAEGIKLKIGKRGFYSVKP
ncbi:tyrosine--tRNA ligase [Candidatus Gracilibacteria bacterium]|nr:tyrosine--tRNA ligase [Candidatus Gracilibacteria bacterium]